MRKIDLSKIKTRKDLNDAIRLLEVSWAEVSKIKDPRKRCKEVVRLKKDLEALLYEYKTKYKPSTPEESNFFKRVLRSIGGWCSKL